MPVESRFEVSIYGKTLGISWQALNNVGPDRSHLELEPPSALIQGCQESGNGWPCFVLLRLLFNPNQYPTHVRTLLENNGYFPVKLALA